MYRKAIFTAAHCAPGRLRVAGLLALAVLPLLLGSNGLGQNITNIVAPGGSVDLLNNSGNRWYFFSAPTPSGTSMARVSSDLVGVYTWPDPANFTADPGTFSRDRIFQGEYLRVYAGSAPVNTVIQIQYATPLPGSGPYYFYITVANAPYVTAINITDPSPTVAATVHWAVTFSAAISGVTAANFILTNPDGLSGASITGVTGSGTSWTVTATTGTGTGLLGCSYVGHVSESPAVPASFTGQQYTFSQYPLITLDPVGSNIVAGASYTMTVAATIRGGGAVNYQWYAGTSVNPAAATAISGATSTSYTASGLAAGTSHQYFCRAISAANTAYTADSLTATVNAFTPVHIVSQPASTAIAFGQTTTINFSVSGTAPHFQWYQGNSGDTTTPVGPDGAFTTPALSANTNYWVLVYNGLPAAYNQNSATATIRVVTSLTGNGPLVVLTNDAFLPTPAFTVKDSAGAFVTNYPVTLTVNPNSAGGSFSGASSTTAISDATGTARATLTANGVAGTYTVTATTGSLVSNPIALRNVAQLAVSTVTDEDNGSIDPTFGTGISLREAVHYAASHPGAHTVTFASALTSGGAAMIYLTNGLLSVAGTTTVTGPADGSLALNGSYASRIFSITPGANVLLNSLTLTNGHSDTNDWGGALVNSGTLALTNCTLAGNVVDGAGAGGAIENIGALTLTGCTLSGNTAGFAGAIRNDSICTLQNCTFYDNVAPANGGAIDNVFGATLNIVNCTFAGNSAGGSGGAIDNYLSTVNLTNSIIAVNTSQDIYNWSGSTISAGGSNIVMSLVNGGGTNNGSASIVVADPRLAAFGQFGGPTQTMPPLTGSPAIDAGLDSVTNFLATDQRGYPRLVGAHVDLGAVEGVYNPTPSLHNPVRLGTGKFQFGFSNLSGPSYLVLAGTNMTAPLNTWSNLGPAVEAPPGTFQFTDPQATNYPRRFYRVEGP